MRSRLILGDCLDVLPTLPADSVDAIVTDPPAGIGFMGREWDDFRRARNGADVGRGNVFGRTSARGPQFGRRGSRNKNGQRDRDRYRAVDPSRPGYAFQGGAETTIDARDAFIEFITEVFAECFYVAKPGSYALVWAIPRTSHWTGMALEYAGWVIQDRISHLFGQGFPKGKSRLKPACEDWWLAWKPANRAGILNIDACRIPGTKPARGPIASSVRNNPILHTRSARGVGSSIVGRWPANVTHDGSPEVMAEFDRYGERPGCSGVVVRGKSKNVYGESDAAPFVKNGDTGTAARFFYCSKASKADRGPGNTHPTVKHTDLMRWLCRLITPANGVVLDPFAGSGSTGVACAREGFGFIGIEQDRGYHKIAARRLTQRTA